MGKGKKYKLAIALLFFAVLMAEKLHADLGDAMCHIGPGGSQVTIFGDSRSADLWRHRHVYITNAEIKINNERKRILAPGQIAGYQPLTLPGSKATDTTTTNAILGLDFLDTFNEKQNDNWVGYIEKCRDKSLNIRTTPKVIVQLGGNDIISFYKSMEKAEGTYGHIMAIINPVEMLMELFGKEPVKFPEYFWMWQFDAKGNEIKESMRTILQYLLDDAWIIGGEPNQVLFHTVAPAFTTEGPGDLFKDDYWRKVVRLYSSLQLLEGKYFELHMELLAHNIKVGDYYVNPYAHRLHFVDMFPRYAMNILWEHASFYFPDGIHFTPAGNEEWARYVALWMAFRGWFDWNPELFTNHDFDGNPDKLLASMNINMKAVQLNFGTLEEVFAVDLLDVATGDEYHPGGFKKVFPGGNVYYQTGHAMSYAVGGAILQRYKELGETEGTLGFPYTDAQCFGPGPACTKKLAMFDCGYIVHDELPFVGGIEVGAFDVCPSFTLAQKKAEPDFTSECELPAGCGRRGFEHYLFRLRPTGGYPPFNFMKVEGDLPPGAILDKNGILRGAPTVAVDSWSFSVVVTDNTGRQSPPKLLKFSSSL